MVFDYIFVSTIRPVRFFYSVDFAMATHTVKTRLKLFSVDFVLIVRTVETPIDNAVSVQSVNAVSCGEVSNASDHIMLIHIARSDCQIHEVYLGGV